MLYHVLKSHFLCHLPTPFPILLAWEANTEGSSFLREPGQVPQGLPSGEETPWDRHGLCPSWGEGEAEPAQLSGSELQ